MKWIAGPVALLQRLDHLEGMPATVGSTATILWRSADCSAVRDTMPMRMLAGSHAPVAYETYAREVLCCHRDHHDRMKRRRRRGTGVEW